MTEVVIKNSDFLAKLEDIRTTLFSLESFGDNIHDFFDPSDAKWLGKYYTSDEYLVEVKSRSHDLGWPAEHFSHPMGRVATDNPSIFKDFYESVKYGFAEELGAAANALFNYYPPGGFVGWHNNWNAAAHQMLFTWSETGDGYFKYQDTETSDIVTILDVKGWQARHYRFDRDKNKRCWHAAYTSCKRITLAYKFSLDNSLILDDLLEEIEYTI